LYASREEWLTAQPISAREESLSLREIIPVSYYDMKDKIG